MTTIFNYLERLRLSTKLVLGFSVGILMALLIGLNAVSSLNTLELEVESMYEKDLLGISHLKEANYQFLNLGRAMRDGLLVEDEATRHAAIAQVKRSREKLLSELDEARRRIFRSEVIVHFDAYQKDLNKVFETFEHMQALLEKEGRFSQGTIKVMTSPELGASFAALNTHMSEMISLKEKAASVTLGKIQDINTQATRTAYTLILVGGGVAILMGIMLSMSIQHPNLRLRQSVEELASGTVNSTIPHTDYPNEVGILARAIEVLQGIYRKAEDTRWIKSHGAEIGAHLQQAEDSRSLAQKAISHIAPVLNAGHGAIYVLADNTRLTLQASYGYRQRKHLNNSFALGEGLVGQCAMEKQPITLTAPKDYIQINSGLGEAPPACVAVLPILHHDNLLGVLELASFQPFTEREMALLDVLTPMLAISMEIMERNQRTRDLLQATQEQSERMEKQAAQLEEQTVEMEAQQSELLETENWFRSIIQTAPDGILVVNESNTIVLTNPSAEALFGYAAGELVGVPVAKIITADVLAIHGGKNLGSVTGLHREGRTLDLDLSLNHLPSRGRHGRCVSVAVRLT